MHENDAKFPNIELTKELVSYFDVSIEYLLDNVTSSNYENELRKRVFWESHWLKMFLYERK